VTNPDRRTVPRSWFAKDAFTVEIFFTDGKVVRKSWSGLPGLGLLDWAKP
jgi:hypothetical protein